MYLWLCHHPDKGGVSAERGLSVCDGLYLKTTTAVSVANRHDEAIASDSKNNKILGVKKCEAF